MTKIETKGYQVRQIIPAYLPVYIKTPTERDFEDKVEPVHAWALLENEKINAMAVVPMIMIGEGLIPATFVYKEYQLITEHHAKEIEIKQQYKSPSTL